MPLIDNHGRTITREELAADLASDLRTYTSLTAEQIDARLWDRYPDVMRRWATESDG